MIRNTTKTGEPRVVPFPPELALLLSDHRRRLIETQHPGLKEGWAFANAVGKPMQNDALFKHNRAVLKHAGIDKHFPLHAVRRAQRQHKPSSAT